MSTFAAAVCVAACLIGPALAAGPCTSGPICQLHLARGTTVGEMRVSWVSVQAHTDPVVQWGTDHSASAWTNSASAQGQTYELKDMCLPSYIGLRGWEAPGSIYHASMTVGAAGADVDLWYRVGDRATGSWSSLVGPVRVGIKRGAGLASFAAFGDMGTYAYAPKVGAPSPAVTH